MAKKHDNTPASRDPVYQYIEDISKRPLISPKKEIELAHKIAKGDNTAKNALIEANLRLVICIARRYTQRGIAFADLIEEGNIGLIRAVEKFDPKYGARFSTYATWWIRQSIERAIMNQSRMIRIPVHVIKKFKRYCHVVKKLQNTLNREPTFKEIAEKLSLPIQEIEEFMQYDTSEISLDGPTHSERDLLMHESLSDPNEKDPLEVIASEEQGAAIDKALAELDFREQDILLKRYGMDRTQVITLDEIATENHLTRERVRQIQLKSIKHLKQSLKQQGVF